MKKHGLWLILSLAIAVLCSLFAYAAVHGGESDKAESSLVQNSASEIPANSPTLPSAEVLRCRYFTQKDFMSSISSTGNQKDTDGRFGITTPNGMNGQDSGRADPASPPDSDDGVIAGGVVPHHLLAGKMIAGFFRTLSLSKPDILIVVAPNHKRVGHSGLNTSLLDWNTAFGTLKAARETENRILSDLDASLNNSLMEEEHSISSLIPYIKYYMPQVEVVPLLLHGNYTADESAKLGNRLAEEYSNSDGKRITIVASVDFSHYLDVETANRMDEETLSAIRSFDRKAVNRMGNDNLDSPPSILALLGAMRQIGADTVEVTGHGNSSGITGKGADYTTSYYTLFFKTRAR